MRGENRNTNPRSEGQQTGLDQDLAEQVVSLPQRVVEWMHSARAALRRRADFL